MKDILEEIIAHKRIEVERDKKLLPPSALYAEVERQIETEHALLINGDTAFRRMSMKKSLAASASGIIAEFKRKSPSKGWIRKDGRPESIPVAYAKAGAAALSILTDEEYFGGSLDFIRTARPLTTGTPILRKEFITDEYQLYQARQARADAVLLIAADLTRQECARLTAKAHELELEVLLEVHTEGELEYAACAPDMIGVNNRHLGTFHTDVENSFRLASLLPDGILPVSESGISRPQTVRELRQAGFRGFLIGETFMRQADPGAALQSFIKEVEAS